jgi:hypothetical protein
MTPEIARCIEEMRGRQKKEMTESLLVEAIEAYTQEHGEMPSQLKGTFSQLQPITTFASYSCSPYGRGIFSTCLGDLELVLDTNASEWYLSHGFWQQNEL